MFNRSISSIFFILIFANAHGQRNGILPLTGIHYFNDGIWAKNIEVNIDGASLLSNRVPLNKDIELKLLAPSGFLLSTGNYYPGAEVDLFSIKGVLLSKISNLFSLNSITGITSSNFKELSTKVMLRQEVVKSETDILIVIKFFDLKSKNQLKIEFPVTITKPGEPLQLSKSTSVVKTSGTATAISNALKIKIINISVDTAIRVNPKMAYLSLDIPEITGSSLDEILAGTESFWVYDNNIINIKPSDKLLKRVGGSMESNDVNYIIKIPLQLKNSPTKNSIIRFRWESKDKKKLFDIIAYK